MEKRKVRIMNKHFKSLKEIYEQAKNYKIDKETKEFSREELEHQYEAQIGTTANYQHVVESILFAIRDNLTTLDEIKQYIEDNDQYMMVYSRV